jgi:SAM-dependent methyltransferase
VKCPVCGGSFRAFARGRCPECGSADRHRLMMLFLRNRTQTFSNRARVLHFAAEPALADALSKVPTLEYLPADLDPPRGFERVDATDIRLRPGFDGIITSHVLEHIPDDRQAMREMYRVLKPGGWALVLVPISVYQTYENPAVTSARERHRHFGQHDHVRLYGYDVTERLAAAGFDVAEERYAEMLGPSAIQSYGLNTLDLIHFCRKPLYRARA